MNGLTPDITTAEVVRHGVLRLTFADGLSEVDVLDRMRGPAFDNAPPRALARTILGRGQRSALRSAPETLQTATEARAYCMPTSESSMKRPGWPGRSPTSGSTSP